MIEEKRKMYESSYLPMKEELARHFITLGEPEWLFRQGALGNTIGWKAEAQ